MGTVPTFSVTVFDQQQNSGASIAERINPSLEVAADISRAVSQRLRVALIGIVQSFDATKQTVTVQVATKEFAQYNTSGSTDSVNVQRMAVALPLLQDVPICFPSFGGWSLTGPIQEGDECLLVFADTALDAWWQSGGSDNNPISSRRHSLSDAVAVFGVRSQPEVLAGYSTSSMQLRNDDATVIIDLADGQITITADAVEVGGPLQVDDAFGCNSKTPQSSFASGGAAASTAPVNISPWGFSTALQAQQIITLLNNIRTALVNNGIMT